MFAKSGLPLGTPEHPADVREPEAAPRGIRVEVDVIYMKMMGAVTAAPVERLFCRDMAPKTI